MTLRAPHAYAAALCGGLACANVVRLGLLAAAVATAMLVCAPRAVAPLGALVVLGCWWGSVRLDAVDTSALAGRVGEAGRIRLVVTGPARHGRFTTTAPARIKRFAELEADEAAQLELPNGRAPPQGAVLEAIGQLKPLDGLPWLRRHGMHVRVAVSTWRVTGRRGGFGGAVDRVRGWLSGSVTRGLRGERAAVIQGIVLGDDAGLSDDVRDRFRAAGLYHLLAVSGQNVALVAGGVLAVAWVLGVARFAAQLAALGAIVAYVLAVGAQPSVVRAGVAGVLGSLAWLAARVPDRWYFLLLGALVLLAWNPYNLRDPGFQLSFAAVAAIFLLVPRFERFLEGYPVGRPLRLVVAVSAACGVATAPIAWLHFHSLQLLSVPANVLAAPAVPALLGVAFAGAAAAPLSGDAASVLAWLNGWCASYLVAVARLVGGLPGAQIQSTRALLVLLAGALLVAAYASDRWCSPSRRAS